MKYFITSRFTLAQDVLSKLPKQTSDKLKEILSDPESFQTIGLWVSSVIAALTAVIYAKLFHFAEDSFHAVLDFNPLLLLVISPILFLVSWYVVYRYAPEAAGSGIPQIMAANEMEYNKEGVAKVDKLLSLKTAVVKIISSLLCVVGGGAIGREGPTLQISTSIFHFFGKQLRKFSLKVDEHILVVAGAAAGLASAFNTPLGGIVYAIEELGLVHFHKVRTALIGGVIVSGLVAQGILGSYLFLGLPKLTVIDFSFLPTVVLNGFVCGVLGAVFGKMLLYFSRSRLKLTKFSQMAVVTGLCGFVLACLAILDSRVAGSGTFLINNFLFKDATSDIALVMLRFFGTIISYLSGAAGGIFSPSLTIGATVGSFLANFIGEDHANLMVLLGMIGFLTGVTRTPFTSFILVLEMTDRHSAIFPMMLVALVAHWSSNLIDSKSFYEHVKERLVQ